MSKRKKMLGLLLAGTIAVSGSGMIYAEAAQQTGKGVVAGVSSVFSDLIAENKASGSAAASEKNLAAVPEPEITEEASASVHDVPVVASEYADIAIAQVNNYVNVRSLPNTESEVLGKLYDNSAATVLETTEDGWYRIQSGSVEGYVKAEYVVVGNEDLARAVSTRYAKVMTMTLFVRNQPTTDSKVLTMLPEGDDLVVIDESTDGWIKVSTVEGDGYVSREYVTLSTDYVEAESKAEEEARLAREEAERQAAAQAAEEARRAREEAERQAAAKSSRKSSSGSSQSAGNSSSKGNTTSGGNISGGNSSTSSGSSVSNGQAVVNYAKQFIGNPYVYGGTSLTNGADCSGFVMSVYAAFGVSLPRTSSAQRSAGYEVSLSEIQPGDLVCYSGHIGIYAGNNTLIHASTKETGIKYTSPITYRKILSVRRIF